MKKFIFLIAITTLLLCGCRRESPVDRNKPIEEELSFKVLKTVLSDGNYSLQPNVQSTSSDDSSKRFIVSLGAMESSSPQLDKVTILNNSLNFYTSVADDSSSDMCIPQISVEVAIPEEISLDDLKFNIVKSNYENLELNYSASQSINKLRSDYGIVSRVKPQTTLVKSGNSYNWNFLFESAFIKDDPLSPLIKVKATVDSEDAEILAFQKDIVSEIVAQGYIEDFNSPYNKMVYSSINTIAGDSSTDVFLKDLNTDSEQLVYSSSSSLKAISISNDSNYLAIVEKSDSKNQILIKNLVSGEVVSLPFISSIKKIVWFGDTLYVSHNPDIKTSEIAKYSFEKNEFEKLFNVAGDITSFSVLNNKIVYSLESSESSIYLFEDGSSRFISSGTLPLFKDGDTVVFLMPSQNSDDSNVLEYKISSDSSKQLLDGCSLKKMFSNRESLYMVVSGEESGFFDLLSYDSSSGNPKQLFTFTNDNIFFNCNTDKIYFSTTTGSAKSRRIYSIEI